jgi:hypothetical protein
MEGIFSAIFAGFTLGCMVILIVCVAGHIYDRIKEP